VTTVLITGISGFVGSALAEALVASGHRVRGAVRRPGAVGAKPERARGVELLSVGDIGPDTQWGPVLDGIDAVVHLAARVRVPGGTAGNDALAAFRRVNTAGTARLAVAAAHAGVRRLVFVSTIKVNGDRTAGRPFTAADRPNPPDPYARSKYEAEQALWSIQREHGLQVVVVRPPLVYGPGVKGNFRQLVRWVESGLPLPLGAVHNRRTLVGLTNLVDLLRECVGHAAAAGQLLLAADPESLSTPELVRRLGTALDRPARLLPVPVGLLRAGSAWAGKQAQCERLCGSLEVDASHTHTVLGWRPVMGVIDELRRLAASGPPSS
jgi:nucleoside-diphosphate-sugar epimerase